MLMKQEGLGLCLGSAQLLGGQDQGPPWASVFLAGACAGWGRWGGQWRGRWWGAVGGAVPGPLRGIGVKWIRETPCPSRRPSPFWASAFRGLGDGVAWCQESVPAPWGPGGACQGCGCRSNSERGAGLKFFSSCLESQHDGLCIPDNQTPPRSPRGWGLSKQRVWGPGRTYRTPLPAAQVSPAACVNTDARVPGGWEAWAQNSGHPMSVWGTQAASGQRAGGLLKRALGVG